MSACMRKEHVLVQPEERVGFYDPRTVVRSRIFAISRVSCASVGKCERVLTSTVRITPGDGSDGLGWMGANVLVNVYRLIQQQQE